MIRKNKDGENSARTKIFVVDDHPVVVEGIIRAFEKEPDFEIVGTASDGLQAVQRVKTLKPDIVIMDISLPHMKGIDATREIKTRKEQIHVLIYSMYSDKEYVTSLFGMGISGYVLKSEPIKNLIRAAKVIRHGGSYFSGSVQEALREHMSALEAVPGCQPGELQSVTMKLTAREREVFLLLADGLTPKEIAQRLFISPKTVETHKYKIMEKLEVNSVAQLTKIAVKKKLIDI